MRSESQRKYTKKGTHLSSFGWCPEPDLSTDVNEAQPSCTAVDAVNFRQKIER